VDERVYRARKTFTRKRHTFGPGDVLPGPYEEWPGANLSSATGRRRVRVPRAISKLSGETGHSVVQLERLPCIFSRTELDELVDRGLASPREDAA
jgi:hypothetical protein